MCEEIVKKSDFVKIPDLKMRWASKDEVFSLSKNPLVSLLKFLEKRKILIYALYASAPGIYHTLEVPICDIINSLCPNGKIGFYAVEAYVRLNDVRRIEGGWCESWRLERQEYERRVKSLEAALQKLTEEQDYDNERGPISDKTWLSLLNITLTCDDGVRSLLRQAFIEGGPLEDTSLGDNIKGQGEFLRGRKKDISVGKNTLRKILNLYRSKTEPLP